MLRYGQLQAKATAGTGGPGHTFCGIKEEKNSPVHTSTVDYLVNVDVRCLKVVNPVSCLA